MNAILKLIRPHHWVKNLFLLIPIFFAGDIFNQSNIWQTLSGVVAFCFVSSVVYVINDLKDCEVDKLHPRKRERPIASGKVQPNVAIFITFLLLIIALFFSYNLSYEFLWILGIYLLINILYSFGLKNIPILDMIILSFGFILRVLAGGVLSDILISEWLIIMIFLLSLFLAIAKRREDILIFNKSGMVSRSSTSNYNLQFIDSSLTLISGVIIVSYLMYTLSADVKVRIHFDYLYTTSVFVVMGIMRYLQITLVDNGGGSPIKILYKDRFIQITLLAWILTFFYIIYFLSDV